VARVLRHDASSLENVNAAKFATADVVVVVVVVMMGET
jgi:hypothetical protein